MPSMTKPERDIASGFDRGVAQYLTADRGQRAALVRQAREALRIARKEYDIHSDGVGTMFTKPEAQPKTGKNDLYTLVFMGSPAKSAGVGNLCPASTAGCRANCLGPHSGHAALDDQIPRIRHARTWLLVQDPADAAVLMTHEICQAVARYGPIAVRLNGDTDLRWELCAPRALTLWHTAGVDRLYDYTKFTPALRGPRPPHYHLTYSWSERMTGDEVRWFARHGANVAVPFMVNKGRDLPATFYGVPVIDGDLTDDRTTDPQGVVVGLRVKGRKARQDRSGFIVRLES